MICLTGDLHHQTLCTGNQLACDITEIEVAQRYNRMIAERGIKVTYFVSGKSFQEQWPELEPICKSPNVEIGGHNWACFKPALPHRIWKKLTGSYNGPLKTQQADAQRTMEIIKQKTGRDVICWRNHMYMHGPFTEQALYNAGIKVCSDGVKAASTGPEWHETGLLSQPLNIIPDHEHLYHAERTRSWVNWWQKRYNWSDDFGPQSYYVEEWTDIVIQQLTEQQAKGVTSTMIIHPITLYLCDGFRSFQRILDYLAGQQTVWMSEVYQKALVKS